MIYGPRFVKCDPKLRVCTFNQYVCDMWRVSQFFTDDNYVPKVNMDPAKNGN